MTAIDTRAIQTALKSRGFDPGPIDGAMGPKTRAAVRAFQAVNKLEVDGIVGPRTRAALFGAAAAAPQPLVTVPTEMPWLVEADRLRGTREIAGARHNPVIMDWAEDLGIPYSADEVPWCGLFVAHCIGSTLPDESMPTNVLGARNWGTFGKPVKPQLGAVMVFWRGSRTGWTGHVAFYWAEDEEAFHVLGGNQSNSVNVTRIGKDRFLDARWPLTVPNPAGIIRRATAGGKVLSINEA